MRASLPFVPLLALLVACDGSDDNTHSQPFVVLECDHSSDTTIEEPSQQVITSAHHFREVYGVTNLNSQNEVPQVDFDTRQVIALHGGFKPSSGYSLRVDHIIDEGEELEVRYTAIEPGADCQVDAAIRYPYCFVSMAKTDRPVTYSRHTEVQNCP